MANNTNTLQSPAQASVERTTAKIFMPRVDISETNDSFVVHADMPGVDPKNLDITIEKNMLTIYGKVNQHEVPTQFEPAYAEYDIGDYQRSFALSDEIDRDRISATMKNGVLTLTLPKARPAQAKKIEVKPS